MSALEDTQPLSLIDIADAMSSRSSGRPDAMSPDILAEPSQDPQLLALP